MVCLGWKTCNNCGEAYQGNLHNTGEDICSACAVAVKKVDEDAAVEKLMLMSYEELLRYLYRALSNRGAPHDRSPTHYA